jgi:glycosyltransferase involved in cell wall biosynthesis
VLLLINSTLANEPEDRLKSQRPALDYLVLRDRLDQRGFQTELVGHESAGKSEHAVVQLAYRTLGGNSALALGAFLRRAKYDAIFTIGESLSIPLAALLRQMRSRPKLVTIGHRLSAEKKQLLLRVSAGVVDGAIVYSPPQLEHGTLKWRIPEGKVRMIPYCVDAKFFAASGMSPLDQQVCSVGSEWRDHDTLLKSVAGMPHIRLKMTAYSPWTKRHREVRALPANADAKRYTYEELRRLYDSSMCSIVSLKDSDFAAGITAVVEAMAMAKPVILTHTAGMYPGIVKHGETGLVIPRDDPAAMSRAIELLRGNSELRARLGRNAREWVERNATDHLWADHIAQLLEDTLEQSTPDGSAVGQNCAFVS